MEIELTDGDAAEMQACFESEMLGREFMDLQDQILASSEVSGRCGKCGGFGNDAHGFTSCGVETFYVVCEDCGFTWGHE